MALLVYGKSSFNGFPYRHPFITMHQVLHEKEGARLGEGRLVTPQMLAELTAALGRSLPLEFLPDRILARGDETIVWWAPAQIRRMFFRQNSSNALLKKLNGELYPHPPLIFKAARNHLWVRALKQDRRPDGETRLHRAPYWNCYDNGAVCTGSMGIPEERSTKVIDQWADVFFASEFTHVGGVRRSTTHAEGLLAMWLSLRGKKRFPAKFLAPADQTLTEFIHESDTSYRNQP